MKDFATSSSSTGFVADPTIKELSKASRSAKETGTAIGRSIGQALKGLRNLWPSDSFIKERNQQIYRANQLNRMQGGPETSYLNKGQKWGIFKDNLVDTLRTASGNFFQALKTGSSDLLNWMRTKSGTFFENFRPRSILATMGGGIGSAVGGAYNAGRSIVSNAPSVVFGTLKQMGTYLLHLPSQISSVFSTLNPFSGLINSFSQFKTLAVLGIGALTVEAIKLSAQFEKIEIGFSSLTKNPATAKQLVKDIRLEAADMPFTSRDMLGAGRRLLAYGVEVKNIIPALRMLGDVTAAVGSDYANLEHFAYLFGTLRQQTHAFTRDLNQFTNLGVPMTEYLGKVMKVNKEEIQGLHEQGKVGFYEYAEAFKMMTREGGHFYQFSERISATLAGRWEALKDNAEIALSKVGDLLVQEFGVKNWVNGLISGLQNIDTWITKNKSDVVYIFDVIKAGGNALYAGAVHLAAGFRVGWEIAQQLFPNTFAYFDKVIKQGKDWVVSWKEAKSNMMDVFESIAMSFAQMIDSFTNGIHTVINEMIKARRILPGSGWSSSEREEYIYNKDPNAYKRSVIDQALQNEILKDSKIELIDAMLRAAGKQGVSSNKEIAQRKFDLIEIENWLKKQPGNAKFYGDEYDRSKGYGLYNRTNPRQNEMDVAEFFRNNRIRVADEELKKVIEGKRERQQLIEGRGNALDLLNPYARGTINENRLGLEENLMEQLKILPKFGFIPGAKQAIVESLYQLYRLPITVMDEINTGEWENMAKRAGKNRQEFNEPPPLIDPQMAAFLQDLKQDISPNQEFIRDINILKKLKNVPGMDPELIARGYAKVMGKAEQAFGLGFENVKLADAVYRGTSEAVAIENKWAINQYGGTQAERFNSLMEESVEVEKQQREYLRQITEALVRETGPMPRELKP